MVFKDLKRRGSLSSAVATTSGTWARRYRIDFEEALRLVLLIFRETEATQKEPLLERS